MMPADLVPTLERGHQIGASGNGRLAPNGEPFRTFAALVNIQDGQADDALDGALCDLLAISIGRFFAADCGEHPWLYWRVKPQIETVDHGETRARSLRCRLLISRLGPPAPDSN